MTDLNESRSRFDFDVNEAANAIESLQEAARELADKAKRLMEAAPRDTSAKRLVVLCGCVAGLILDPGQWRFNLGPMSDRVVEVARAGLPAMEARLGQEELGIN